MRFGRRGLGRRDQVDECGIGRLERNRASARVRREKKKGMVETYEGEVSKLENSLNLLKSHQFGNGQAQELQSALGMWLTDDWESAVC